MMFIDRFDSLRLCVKWKGRILKDIWEHVKQSDGHLEEAAKGRGRGGYNYNV